MEIKPFYVLVAALLAIALAIGIFAARPAQVAVTPPTTQEPTKTVTVYAQGSIAVTPTAVDLAIEIWATGKNVADASAALQRADKSVREALAAAGLAPEQFVLDLHYNGSSPPLGQAAPGATAGIGTAAPETSGTRLHERILVGGLEPKMALKVIDVVGTLGYWAGPVRYQLKDEERAIQSATEKAMRTARGQADTAAQAGGMKIRGVRSVTIEPPGAFYGPQPATGGTLAEPSSPSTTQPSSSATSGTTATDAYPILWHPTLPSLNPDGTILVTIRIRAEFEF